MSLKFFRSKGVYAAKSTRPSTSSSRPSTNTPGCIPTRSEFAMPVAFAPSCPSPCDVRRALDGLRSLVPGDVVPSYARWTDMDVYHKEKVCRGLRRSLHVLYRLDAITRDERGWGQVKIGTLSREIEFEVYGDVE